MLSGKVGSKFVAVSFLVAFIEPFGFSTAFHGTPYIHSIKWLNIKVDRAASCIARIVE